MGGSGGGGYFSGSLESVKRLQQTAESELSDAGFEAEVNGYLGSLLQVFNDRDIETTQHRLDTVRAAIEREHGTSADLLFGGSVAKKTYVDGISDVDALVFVDETTFAGRDPESVRDHLAELLKGEFGEAKVSVGRLAVTIEFDDVPLQILPALRSGERALISDPSGKGWAEIDPKGFARKLSEVNAGCGMKVVPVVKLAKALIASLPEKHHVTGYHLEALAVDVFKKYDGRLTPSAMLQHLFAVGAERVMAPIVDSTGQSIHVDSYLGAAGSTNRQIVADAFRRMARRMKLAGLSGDLGTWKSLFSEVEGL